MKLFKLFILFLIVTLALPAAMVFAADADKGCAAKRAAIEKRITVAKEKDNADQLAGLERALDNVIDWCSHDNLKAKAEYEIWEKEQDVAECIRELDKAKAKGKADKIAKRERKLSEAQAELEEARAKLKALN